MTLNNHYTSHNFILKKILMCNTIMLQRLILTSIKVYIVILLAFKSD